MSANLGVYSLLFVAADGHLLVEEESIQITRKLGSKPVETIHAGYAGESPGSPIIEFTVQSAIPSAGFEFDAGQKMLGLIPFDFQVFGPGDKSARGKAWILSDTISHSVHAPSAYKFTARAKLALFR